MHCLIPGIGAQGGSSDGSFTLGRENKQGLPLNREGVGVGEPWIKLVEVVQRPWKTMLLAGVHKRVCTSGDARL